jgi:ATP-dependent Clp protease ATP-binding subunit ClpA
MLHAAAVPDKAIDLVDEACANVRVQLDSVPEEIDVLRRQKYRLEVEEKAISKEKDKVISATALLQNKVANTPASKSHIIPANPGYSLLLEQACSCPASRIC